MSFERITIVANIGSVELRAAKEGGASFIEMRVCVDRVFGQAKQSVWYKVLLFGSMAKDGAAIKARYTVGRQVLVEGRPQNEVYKKADGTPGLDQAIIAISMPELLGYKRVEAA